MRKMFAPPIFSLVFALWICACNSQTQSPVKDRTGNTFGLVGGPCDGCDIMFVGMPANINEVDTSAGWHEPGQPLLVRGTLYKRDGKTPAAGVVIYYWQTDHAGYYSPREGMHEKAKPHGHIRGWVKTDKNGKYWLYTVRPAPYPNEKMPAHIHTLMLEPGIRNPYYIDDFVFDDDPLVTEGLRKAMQNRGGSGILRVKMEGRIQVVEPVSILGLNIPGYPAVQ